jgi:hypothetical protein
MLKETKILKMREIFMKYVAGDGLKPEYDGMTAYEICSLMLGAIDEPSQEEQELEEKQDNQHDFGSELPDE